MTNSSEVDIKYPRCWCKIGVILSKSAKLVNFLCPINLYHQNYIMKTADWSIRVDYEDKSLNNPPSFVVISFTHKQFTIVAISFNR